MRDSWKIAEYLEERYPESPALRRRHRPGMTQTFNTWVDRVLVAMTMPVIVCDLHERIDPGDEEYFRRQFEGYLKSTLEEARARREEFAAASRGSSSRCRRRSSASHSCAARRRRTVTTSCSRFSSGRASRARTTYLILRILSMAGASECSTCTMALRDNPHGLNGVRAIFL